MAYDARMKALSDEKSRIEGAKAEATAETTAEIAARLLNMGIDLKTIAEATGMSVEEIKALQAIN